MAYVITCCVVYLAGVAGPQTDGEDVGTFLVSPDKIEIYKVALKFCLGKAGKYFADHRDGPEGVVSRTMVKIVVPPEVCSSWIFMYTVQINNTIQAQEAASQPSITTALARRTSTPGCLFLCLNCVHAHSHAHSHFEQCVPHNARPKKRRIHRPRAPLLQKQAHPRRANARAPRIPMILGTRVGWNHRKVFLTLPRK